MSAGITCGIGFQSAPRDCSRGDPPVAFLQMVKLLFQSAPRDCSRGDVHPTREREPDICFNPHPVIAHGVTDGMRREVLEETVSIRTP